ncbi:MAG: NifB/NifX family molybdenum-iron cluster-binding protein [Deltaproteobacteria bacterium]|nr:NifB/NifX family molybdenum-iron cluster-binding protein [Deltaproteobacteria bacterium]
MKIAFTTTGEKLDGALESRFGRAPRFLLYDLEKETFDLIDNQQALNAPRGAGIQAADTIVRSGAKVVVTGHCGPKAFQVLRAAGISVYHSDAATVAEALSEFRSGGLSLVESADVEGHWA